MEPSIFSDTQSLHKSSKIKIYPQIYTSAVKSESGKMKSYGNVDAQKRENLNQTKSAQSKSYLLKSIYGSQEDLYTQTKASSYCEEEYEKDEESEIEEMKQLVKNNRYALKSFYYDKNYRQPRSSRLQSQSESKVQKNTYFSIAEQDKRQMIVKLCVFAVVLVIFFVVLYKYGNIKIKQAAISNLGNGLSTCWDNFKKQNCDLNNPVGPFCKKLLECTLNKQNHDKEKNQIIQQSESLIEEFCSLGIVFSLIYLFGVKKTLQFSTFLFNQVKNMYDHKKEEVFRRNDRANQKLDN